MQTASTTGTQAPAESPTDIRTLTVVGIAHGTSHFFHLVLPPLFPFLMKDFSLSFTQVGGLMSIFFVVSGIGQALAGFAVDRVGGQRVLATGLALLACAGIALGLANSVFTLSIAAALAGLGNSVFHPADYSILNHRVSQKRLPLAFSIHGLSGNLGWVAAPLFMMSIAHVSNWHVAGFAASIVALASLALVWSQRHLLEYATDARDTRAASGAQSTYGFLGVPAIWMCFAFFFLTTTAFGALQNFSPALLSGMYGVSLQLGAGGLTAYLIGSAAGMAMGGFAAGKLGPHDRVIFAALSLSAATAAVLSTGWLAWWLVLPGMALLGFGVRQATTASLGGKAFGRVYGFVYSGLDTGLAFSPLLFGPMMDHGRYSTILFTITILQCLAIGTGVTVGSRGRAAAARGSLRRA